MNSSIPKKFLYFSKISKLIIRLQTKHNAVNKSMGLAMVFWYKYYYIIYNIIIFQIKINRINVRYRKWSVEKSVLQILSIAIKNTICTNNSCSTECESIHNTYKPMFKLLTLVSILMCKYCVFMFNKRKWVTPYNII